MPSNNSKSALRIGIVGCGQVARNAHLPLIQRIAGATVTAVADTDREALRSACTISTSAQRFSSGQHLIASGLIDAVLIATPGEQHADIAKAAFDRELHVYLEKPIANDSTAAKRIVTAWRKSGKVGAIGFNYRFNTLYVKLRRAIDDNRIGKIHSISTVFRVPRPQSASWRASRATGGGVLLDLASHHVDLIRFISGDEIESVAARTESRVLEDDFAQLELATASGLATTSTFEYADAFEHTFRVDGENGSAFIDIAASHDVELNGLLRRFPTPARVIHIYGKLKAPLNEPSYLPALSAFVNAIDEGRPASPDLSDGLAALQVIEAAETSASTGLPVAIGNQAVARS